MSSFVAAVDCGTTAVKSAIIGLHGELKGFSRRDTPCIQAPGGRIENDPRAMFLACCGAIRSALKRSGVRPGTVAGMAIANQRATVLCIGADGAVLGNALSWQDMRGTAQIEALRARVPDPEYYAITGLPNHAVFTLAKLLWVKEEDPDRYRRTARFVLVQDYLLKELGCDDYVCDRSNASLTGLLDGKTLTWSQVLLAAAGLERARFSELVPSGTPVGKLSRQAARLTGLLEGTPLVSGGGDQQCAGVGAGAVTPGVVEITLGTAAVPLCCSPAAVRDSERRVMCCVHAVPGQWNVEGLQNSAGSCLEWLGRVTQDGKRLSRAFFGQVGNVEPGAGGVLFYPYLAGDSAPHWSPDARGVFWGLSLASGKADLARAIMEGVSLQTREVLDVFASLGIPVLEIRLTGGCTAIAEWNQIQADLFGRPVSTLDNPEATLVGAAILAAKGVGAFSSVAAAARRMVGIRKTYQPERERTAQYDTLSRKFRAIRRGIDDAGLFKIRGERG